MGNKKDIGEIIAEEHELKKAAENGTMDNPKKDPPDVEKVVK